jgi:perosamine synthetase
VFVDIDEHTLNIAPSAVESAITARTRAILVVHTFGVPAAMNELLDIARRHNLQIIEDACEALGGEYQGRKLGALGRAGVFGFYPNKQITTGEGGILVTDDARMAARARSLRNQGRGETGDWFEHAEIGYNYRLPELNCALGIAQMRRLPGILKQRAAVAQMYFAALQLHGQIEPPPAHAAGGRISWFVYVVRLAKEFQGARRDAVVAAMHARGIGCARYFAPIHLQRAYRDVPHRCMDLTITEALSLRTLALPFFNQLRLPEVLEVCATLQEILGSV